MGAIALRGRGSAGCSGATAAGRRCRHNIILGAVGGLILWFGWYGLQPGQHACRRSTMQGIGRVSFNTTMAACFGRTGGAVLRLRQDWEMGSGG